MEKRIAAEAAYVSELRTRIADLKARERAGELECCAECSGLNDLEWDLALTEQYLEELQVAA